jgi:hypothetical protein
MVCRTARAVGRAPRGARGLKLGTTPPISQTSTSRRAPRGARGLKHIRFGKVGRIESPSRAPRGARGLKPPCSTDLQRGGDTISRAPRGARGLKQSQHVRTRPTAVLDSRAPRGARGLKLDFELENIHLDLRGRAPRGARGLKLLDRRWRNDTPLPLVAPRAGARIETGLPEYGWFMTSVGRRAPRGRAD